MNTDLIPEDAAYANRIIAMRNHIAESRHHELMGRYEQAHASFQDACECCPNDLHFLFPAMHEKMKELHAQVPTKGWSRVSLFRRRVSME